MIEKYDEASGAILYKKTETEITVADRLIEIESKLNSLLILGEEIKEKLDNPPNK